MRTTKPRRSAATAVRRRAGEEVGTPDHELDVDPVTSTSQTHRLHAAPPRARAPRETRLRRPPTPAPTPRIVGSEATDKDQRLSTNGNDRPTAEDCVDMVVRGAGCAVERSRKVVPARTTPVAAGRGRRSRLRRRSRPRASRLGRGKASREQRHVATATITEERLIQGLIRVGELIGKPLREALCAAISP